jgi:hypothetical protein
MQFSAAIVSVLKTLTPFVIAGVALVQADRLAGAERPEHQQPGRQWVYTAEPDHNRVFVPQFCPVVFSELRPDRCVESAAYRGRSRRYAQIRYGAADSNRVILVLDEINSRDADLYVDANRNRVIESKERVVRMDGARGWPAVSAGDADQYWRTSLAVETLRGDAAQYDARQILVRRRAASRTMAIATLGYMVGQVAIDGRVVPARRVDGDANGLFADPADRLWLDLNADGLWDPFTEQFPFATILRLKGRPYAMAGDRLGRQFRLDPAVAEGAVRLVPKTLPSGTKVRRLEAMLVGQSGSVFAISGDREMAVPAGRYKLGSVTITVEGTSWNDAWTFVFSRLGEETSDRWHDVRPGAVALIDPIGKVALRFEGDELLAAQLGDGSIALQAALTTGDGLTANAAMIGDADPRTFDPRTAAKFRCVTADGKVVSDATTSFGCGFLCKTWIGLPRELPAELLKLTGEIDTGPLSGTITISQPIRAQKTEDKREKEPRTAD